MPGATTNLRQPASRGLSSFAEVIGLIEDVAAVKHYLVRLLDAPAVKAGAVAVVWASHLLFGPKPWSYLDGVVTLWVWDWITGLCAALADPAKRIKSRRWYHALIKLFLYLVLMSIGLWLRPVKVYIVGLTLQSAIEGLILATESKSIVENLRRFLESPLCSNRIFDPLRRVVIALDEALNGLTESLLRKFGMKSKEADVHDQA